MHLTNRRISSTFLLAIILPIIFLAPFHHHEEPLASDISCDACAHHQPHPGHLSEQPGTHDCLICQLLGQQYVPSVGPAVTLPGAHFAAPVAMDAEAVILRSLHQSSPRAPPVSFCF